MLANTFVEIGPERCTISSSLNIYVWSTSVKMNILWFLKTFDLVKHDDVIKNQSIEMIKRELNGLWTNKLQKVSVNGKEEKIRLSV